MPTKSHGSIVIVGEAWGEEEDRLRLPFVGPAGYCLNKMLEQAGIERAHCNLTNVFNLRPADNDIETLCGPKTSVENSLPALRQGKYIKDQYLGELTRLYQELDQWQPNLIVAAGATAAWALLGYPGISRIRGAVATAKPLLPGVSAGLLATKVLPIYHPAAILRQWELRHVTVLDLIKARRESNYPELRRPFRKVYIEPTLRDLDWFYSSHLESAKLLSFDIETAFEGITCIGFAPDHRSALVVPFVDLRKPTGSYWMDHESEVAAWTWVRKVLGSSIPKLGQNGVYDITWLWSRYGIAVRNYREDTMLLHHALYPEESKGLGFLGSVYTDEASWKLMAKHSAKKGDQE